MNERTQQDLTAAVAKSREVRSARAEYTRRMKAGEMTLRQVIELVENDSQHPMAGQRVSRVLRALPGWGPVRAGSVMIELALPENRRLRGLGERQKKALLSMVEPLSARASG